MTILIKNLAIAGYRSFGEQPQYFDNFEKINFFIGKNNCGKSNVLRVLTDIYPHCRNNINFNIGPFDSNLPSNPQMKIGQGRRFKVNNNQISDEFWLLPPFKKFDTPQERWPIDRVMQKVLSSLNGRQDTDLVWSYIELPSKNFVTEGLDQALEQISDADLHECWKAMTDRYGGTRVHWLSDVISFFKFEFEMVESVLIPAIRKVGAHGSKPDDFSGEGIIVRLAELQDPDATEQFKRKRFDDVTKFVQTVLDNPDARINVPHHRQTINIYLDGKWLPLESLGSGIYEVVILAVAATVLENTVVCIEEPELHLNPILQKKLVRYLSRYTNNQYFITTHSAALMDTPGAEIYHIKLEDGCSIVTRATTDSHKSTVCEDLGYHPSDLLQSNCVIWVEGPSDRIYVSYWLSKKDPQLIEGIHYSIMFYGGRLLSHLSNELDESAVKDFIELRRLNRRGVILIDSDKNDENENINKTKNRLKEEFDQGPGFAWITEGREIENYLSGELIKEAISKLHPDATLISDFSKFSHCLEIQSAKRKVTTADKVKVAHYIKTKDFEVGSSVLDLDAQLSNLVKFIRESNPGLVI